jgi:hypothetical protein
MSDQAAKQLGVASARSGPASTLAMGASLQSG